MTFRTLGLASLLTLVALPGWTQTIAPAPPRPFAVGAIGGMSAGHGNAGLTVGGTFTFDVTDRIAVEARGVRAGRGSGERGTEMSGTMLFTLARTTRARPYAAIGGGVYRTSFDLGDPRLFGMMNGQYAAGTPFVAIQGMPGYAMMGPGSAYRGSMWQGTWTGATFTASQMPMFYANRLGPMTVSPNGQWGMRAFTDPALTIGGGLRVDLTNRVYVSPDLRGLVVFSRGNHMTLMTMNVALGVRF
jgi:hypothetical protein